MTGAIIESKLKSSGTAKSLYSISDSPNKALKRISHDGNTLISIDNASW